MAEPAESAPPAAPAPAQPDAPPAPVAEPSGEARLRRAFDAPAAVPDPADPAAPEPDDSPAAPSDPYAGLSREEKLARYQADPLFEEEVRGHARREVGRREAEAREAQLRELQVRQQHEAAERQHRDLLDRLERTREYRQIVTDPFHERFPEAQQWLLENTDQDEQRLLEATVFASPQFRQHLGQYQEQVRTQSDQAAVQATVHQAIVEAGLDDAQLAALRADPSLNTIYKFVTAVHVLKGWVSPETHKKELEAARQEGRRAGLGGWADERDYAPSLGAASVGGTGAGGRQGLYGAERLRAAFAADTRRAANGSRSE